jgi:hypothetical protein
MYTEIILSYALIQTIADLSMAWIKPFQHQAGSGIPHVPPSQFDYTLSK